MKTFSYFVGGVGKQIFPKAYERKSRLKSLFCWRTKLDHLLGPTKGLSLRQTGHFIADIPLPSSHANAFSSLRQFIDCNRSFC